jgi:hypothetical protein
VAIALAAAMGGLLFGWDWVVIGGAEPFFERYLAIYDGLGEQLCSARLLCRRRCSL